MSQWFLSYDGKQIGPLSLDQAVSQARTNPNGFAWRQGLAEWLPIGQVAELTQAGSGPGMAPPPPQARNVDEIDFKVFGAEMQFVEVELDPGESAIAEAGAMMYKDSTIQMQTIFGDGSAGSGGGGFMDKLLGAGKRILTGESLFMTVFTHTGQGKGHVAFGAPYPGNIIPIHLSNVGGCLICQKDSFLCAAKGVAVGIFLQRKILTGLFGGEGFIMQKLEGNGQVFIHAGGTVVERELQAGEVLHVDTGCVVAFEPSVNFDIQQAGGIKTALFGGEGLFFANLQGPGRIWLQSLPFSRLAGRMLQAAPQRGGGQEEGSILGPLGSILGGDR
ncbi:MAG: TIGR00266 family protein [Deltaproteobacteria bacterium]|nr:TIGR00266 family protein [Deltaproteobacteria bacterium]